MCKAFIAMPFGGDFDSIADELKTVLDEHGFEAKRADDFLNQQSVLGDIVVPINDCDIAIIDLTGLNPNVMYELGLAHALDTPVIMITQDLEELPFDIRSYRALEYSPLVRQFEIFREALIERLNNIADVTFGSPVSDYLNRPPPRVRCNKTDQQDEPRGEREDQSPEPPAGYLDHLEEIQQGADLLTEDFTEIASATEDVGESIRGATAIIQRAQSQSGPAQIRTVRIGANAAAEALRAYTARIREPGERLTERWPRVDEALAAILDWQMEHVDDADRARLLELLDGLDGLRATASSVQPAVTQLRTSVRSSYGFDRGLNREIDNSTNELNRLIALLADIAAPFGRARQYRERLSEAQGE